MFATLSLKASPIPYKKVFSAPLSIERLILKCMNIHDIEILAARFDFENPSQELKSFKKNLEEVKNRLVFNTLSDRELCPVFKILLFQACTGNSPSYSLVEFAEKIKINFGEGFFLELFNVNNFLNNKNNISLFISVCEGLCSFKADSEIAKICLRNFSQNNSFTELNELIFEHLESCRQASRSFEEVLEDFKSTNKNLIFPLCDKDIKTIKTQCLEVLKYAQEIKDMTEDDLREYYIKIRNNCDNKKIKLEDKLFLLAAAGLRIQKEFGIYPYSSQILTILALTLPKNNLKGRIAQVKTGEGKSVINMMLALCFAMEGKCVDIITSSRSLATRDQVKFKNFFQYFGVSTSHICEDQPTSAHFQGQIIFGTNTDFEFSLLRELTSEEKVRKHFQNPELARPCEVALVDEVDNLLIDKSINSAYIAIPYANKNEKILMLIFSEIIKYKKEELLPEWDLLCERIRSHSKEDDTISSVLNVTSNSKLKIYIENAIKALWHTKEKKDYIIHEVEEENTFGKKSVIKKLIIMDLDTGSLQEGCRWQDGLHEFVELRHDISLNAETRCFAALCHPVFLGYYQEIYGLTGTIGSELERKEVEYVYQVDSFQVPTYHPPKRKTLEPLVCETDEIFFKRILTDIRNAQIKKRPVLILCQTIEESEKINNFLEKEKFKTLLLNGKQRLSEKFILSRAGNECSITVATNTASRGTDIILSKKSIENKGLHVMVTYFPTNERVEMQAIGRAGRQGQPGTSRIIVPPYDPFLQKIKLKTKMTYELLLEKREELIKEDSQARSFRSDIEKVNHIFTEEFFSAFQKFSKNTSDENLLLQKEPSINEDVGEENKRLYVEYMSTQWVEFLENQNHIVAEISREKNTEKLSLQDKTTLYKEERTKAWQEFKTQHPLFFANSKTANI